jgi:superfamily II DNA/RNA helicase
MGLSEGVLRGIYGHGFVKPSPIQQKGILPILQNRDTIAQAQSGTGKTGCFTIATLSIIDTASINT